MCRGLQRQWDSRTGQAVEAYMPPCAKKWDGDCGFKGEENNKQNVKKSRCSVIIYLSCHTDHLDKSYFSFWATLLSKFFRQLKEGKSFS